MRGSQEKVGLAQAVYDSVRDKSFSSRSLPDFHARPFIRRLTDTSVSSTNPSANRRCLFPLAFDKALTPPSFLTSPHPRAGPARRASRTARYQASARTRIFPLGLRSAPVAKSPSGWRREARDHACPPLLPRKAKRARRGRRKRRFRRRRRLRLPLRPPRAP